MTVSRHVGTRLFFYDLASRRIGIERFGQIIDRPGPPGNTSTEPQSTQTWSDSANLP
jgi:hypothetical protein